MAGSVEASSRATVTSVRPSFAYNDQQLAPFVEGGASGSRDGRAEGGGVQGEVVSDDHNHDEDGAICFDQPGEAPYLRVSIPADVPVPSAEMVR